MPRLSIAEPVAIGHAAPHARRRHDRPSDQAARTDRASADAWTLFWREQAEGSRCGVNAPADMRRALDSHWRAFASALAPTTNVLDIGCGAGAVGRELLAVQARLRIAGIDFAAISPSADPRIELLPDTPMESLPFADRGFGAAVSQFGYEYGQVRDAAPEIARVIVPGAPLSLLVHHSDSPIVADSVRHRRALEQLTGAPLKAAFMSGDPAALERQIAGIRRDCGGEWIVDQAAHGLGLRIHGTEAERADVWNAVIGALEPELIMLRSLEASAVAPQRITRWLEPLAARFDLDPPSTLRMPGNKILAWKIEGRRR